MVNLGRPSKDCLPCRRRKLRCDLRAEGCSQCWRAKLACHGYRDLKDLAFRDETRATESKVLGRQRVTQWAHPTVLHLGWDVRSRHAFFCIYVTGLSRSCDALISLYDGASAGQPLLASVDAVSLAFTSFQYNIPSLMHRANEAYVVAVQRLAETLRNPHWTNDETLQSVLLLDVYEKITNRRPRNHLSWLSHVEGAMSLVKARGDEIVLNPTASQLAQRVAVTLTISCGAATIPVPDAVVSLRRMFNFSKVDIKWDFTALLVDVVNLRAGLHNGRLRYSAKATERAKEIDDRLCTLESTLPFSWKPRRVYTVRHDSLVFGRYYDVYPSHFVTQVWNAIRLIRLEMTDLVRRCGPGNQAVPSNADPSTTIDNIVRSICAAVPQFLLPDARPDNLVPFSPLQSLQCCTMLTSLYLASQLTAHNYIREWIRQCMEHMATVGSIKIAKDVADVMRKSPGTDYWTIYAMTGSYAIAA